MSDRIREARLSQPIAELERKANKAICRSNLWTAEELDLARAQGRKMHEALKGSFSNDPHPAKPISDRMSVGE